MTPRNNKHPNSTDNSLRRAFGVPKVLDKYVLAMVN